MAERTQQQHERTGDGAQPELTEEMRHRSTSDLLGDLAREVGNLIREEFELAKAEMTEKARAAGLGAGLLAAAGVSALMMLGTLTALAVIALGYVMSLWLSALIVSVGWAVIAIALYYAGRSSLKEATPPAPEQTIDTLKEDVQWAKHPTRYEER